MTDVNTTTTDEEATAIEAGESAKPWDPDADPDSYTRDEITPKDWYLETVLDFSHGFNDEHMDGIVGLTVIAGGAVVSGISISRAAWIAGMVDLYTQANVNTAPHIEKLFNFAHDTVAERAKSREEADLPTRARGFLHMKDARIGVGDTYTQVPLWRGALADITGWSLGSWNPKQNPAAD